MAKIVNADTILDEKIKNKHTVEVNVYAGNAEANKAADTPVTFDTGKPQAVQYKGAWENSAERYALYNSIHEFQSKYRGKMENSATAPSQTEISAFFAKLFIDREREADKMIDLQPLIAQVITMSDAQEVSYLRQYLNFIGKEKIISGTNDKVPLIEEKTASTEQIVQEIRAFGHKNNLKDMLFNPIPVLQRVTSSAATITSDFKNDEIIRPIVTTTYGAKHKQVADTTGATFDLKMYNTLRNAKKTLGHLYHPGYTKKLNCVMNAFAANVSILCNPNDADDINRVVNGFLFVNGGWEQNVQALSIKSVIPYAGGIMDGETYLDEVLSLPGVTEGKCYMYMPGQSMILYKRDTTMETGTASVLDLATRESAWYRVRGINTSWMIGGAATNTGFGTIIEVTLPTA